MAGGEGKRLRPITDDIPKPLLPIDNVPAIVRTLRYLSLHGISEAIITVSYLADKIEKTLGGECEGVKIKYLREDKPLGSAGGIKAAKALVGEGDFLVLNGDVLTDVDLYKAVSLHKEKGSVVTFVLTHQSDPSEYGVVLIDNSGRVSGFSEKPSLSSTYADTVNSGIYVMSDRIFDYIPDGKAELSNDVLPKLLEKNEKLYGVVCHGYWCDIGDYHSYRMANLRYTDGGNTVGEDCFVPKNTALGTVFLDRVRVGHGARIENSVICSDVTIGNGVKIGENCVIGHGCDIGENAIICAGTVLESESVIPEGSFIKSGNAINRSSFVAMLNSNGVRVDKINCTPSFFMKLGSALTVASGFGRIGLMSDGSEDSERAMSALLRGISSAGGESMLLGEGFEAAASLASRVMTLDVSVFIRKSTDHIMILLYDENGLYPKRSFERALISAIMSDPVRNGEGRRLSRCDFVNDHYIKIMCRNRCDLEGFKVSVKRENSASEMLRRVLSSLGAEVGNEGVRLSVSDDGFTLGAEQNGFVCDDWHIKALLLKYIIRSKVALPISSPAVLWSLTKEKLSLYSHCPIGCDEDGVRRMAGNCTELVHACGAAAELIALLSVSKRSLKELCSRLPSFAYTTYILKTTDRNRFGILNGLGDPDGDGVISSYAYGRVRVIPRREGYELRSEAASGEYASELISLSEKEIKRLLEASNKEK